MKRLIIYGLGDFAKAMRYYFAKDTTYQVVAFCADKNYISQDELDGLPVVPFENVENVYHNDEFTMFVAIGYSRMRARKLMYDKARNKRYEMANYISPLANVDPSIVFGMNNVVLQGSQIEPFCTIGDNNIIWSSVNVSHNVQIGSHCFIASQSLLGGRVKVGDGCFLGFNCTILPELMLADETLVGAKSLVVSTTKPFSKNIGLPSRVVGFHTEEGIVIK
jgi:UDP-N-acetylbacillosamine N-acetyltransferase